VTGSEGTAPQRTPLVVAIDGPAGSGKSTVARLVAERVGLPHLDTGAMYRSVALMCLRRGVSVSDVDAVAELADDLSITLGDSDGGVFVDGEDVSVAIRTPEVDVAVGPVASNARVRAGLVDRQRAWAAERGGAVMEGRDIATVVFPGAPVQVYLTASDAERAKRRAAQSGEDVDAVAADIARRDHVDSTRAADPLRVADGATLLDTTGLSIDQVVERIAAMVDRARAIPAVASSSVAASSGASSSGASKELVAPTALIGDGLFGRGLYRAVQIFASVVNGRFFRIRYHGTEKIPQHGAFLLSPVHRSVLDFLIVGSVTRRRMRYVGKESVWKPRWFRPIANHMGGIKVERGTADRESMRRCLEVLAAGQPLVLFPEGTRKEGPVVQEIYEGAVYIAAKAGVPIVPVGIGGSAAAMPLGAKFPRRVRIDVVIGDAVVLPPGVKASSRKGLRAMNDELRAAIQRVFDEATAINVERTRSSR
jgi:pantoate ligase / CMP/dCMP kinase